MSRRPSRGDEGFTLIEILVALIILMLVAAATLPLLVTSVRAGLSAKLSTQAKNIAQARLEGMRNLPFHVDRQNGPFVDLLDDYYTGVVFTTPVAEPAVPDAGPGAIGGDASGQWVSSAAGPGEPPVPFFRVSVSQVPGSPGFSQVIDTQFLNATGGPLPATALPAGYDNLVVGADTPPSLFVGVTVLTRWVQNGMPHTYSVYTQIADGGTTAPTISSQALADVVRLSSAAYNGTAITGDVGRAEADGGQSTSSTAGSSADGADVVAGNLGRIDGPGNGAPLSVSAPGAGGALTAGSTGQQVSTTAEVLGTAPCGWSSFGPTSATDVSASIAGGLPDAPEDASYSSSTPALSAALSGSGAPCAPYQYSNQIPGSPGYLAALELPAGAPLALITAGDGNVATGSAAVAASPSTSSPHDVLASAGASLTSTLELFPSTLVGDGGGVVDITLPSAALSCSSAAAAAASYSVTVSVWVVDSDNPGGHRVSVTRSYSLASPGTDPLSGFNLTVGTGGTVVGTENGSPVYLGQFITSWSTNPLQTAPTNGLYQFTNGGALTVTTAPVYDPTTDPTGQSALNVSVGSLSCSAVDLR